MMCLMVPTWMKKKHAHLRWYYWSNIVEKWEHPTEMPSTLLGLPHMSQNQNAINKEQIRDNSEEGQPCIFQATTLWANPPMCPPDTRQSGT